MLKIIQLFLLNNVQYAHFVTALLSNFVLLSPIDEAMWSISLLSPWQVTVEKTKEKRGLQDQEVKVFLFIKVPFTATTCEN